MTLKEKFESHFVVWGLSLIALGFGAGLVTRGFLPPTVAPPTAVPPTAPTTINCRVEGMDVVEQAHQATIKPLYDQLVKLEANASNHQFLLYEQRKYKDSADRIRRDIEVQNSSYHTAIQSLTRKCE